MRTYLATILIARSNRVIVRVTAANQKEAIGKAHNQIWLKYDLMGMLTSLKEIG